MRRPFLTASWTNLSIVTYAVPTGLLEARLPPGLELDMRDGQAFVSLVGFDFSDTRVFGCRWPGYRRFPELNLRYYVRCGESRGVVFIREFVQNRLVAWIARAIYNENYRVAPLTSSIREDADRITVDHRLAWAGRTHTISVTGRKSTFCPAEDSAEHFLKEQRWGFGVDRRGRTICYEVHHPLWRVHPVESYGVELDWGEVYGPEWKILQDQSPCSVLLAAGSPIVMYRKALLDPVHVQKKESGIRSQESATKCLN